MTSSSTTSPTLHEWLVIVPDNPEPYVLPKRAEVRPEHLTAAKDLVAANKLLFGGAFFDEPPPAGEAPKVKGTALLTVAESKEAVLEQLRQDPYTKHQVWDLDKVQIWAFKTALRKPLDGGAL